MKKICLFLICICLHFLSVQGSDIYVLSQANWWERHAGYLSDMHIEVIPYQHYARISLNFHINVDSVNYYQYGSYSSNLPNHKNQNLEGVLHFKLPDGSYFYDSYLWLNPSTIIRASIMGNSEASRIYDSIVNRRTDPSILRKNEYDGSYSLNVFPMSTTFQRRVEIAYSIPYQLTNKNKSEYLELPNDILKLVPKNQTIQVLVRKIPGMEYLNTVFPLSSSQTIETTFTKSFSIDADQFAKNHRSFIEFENYKQKPIAFICKPINTNEGYYEIRINTSTIPELINKTSAFSINLPHSSGGFGYQKANNSKNQLSPSNLYIESGKYSGSFRNFDSVQLIYKIGEHVHTIKDAIDLSDSSLFIHQNWTALYCAQYNDDNAVKYSLENRVLIPKTAFLALENGDTVASSKENQGMGGGVTMSIRSSVVKSEYQVYPNHI